MLGKVNLKDSYAIIKNGEVFVLGMHISPYEQGNIFNNDPAKKDANRAVERALKDKQYQ